MPMSLSAPKRVRTSFGSTAPQQERSILLRTAFFGRTTHVLVARLGDNWLNLFDIFNLKLGAELTTLSACETGMSAFWEGDELLGLARGFLMPEHRHWSSVCGRSMIDRRATDASLLRRFARRA